MNAWMKTVFVAGVLCLIGSMASVVAGNEEVAGFLGFAALGSVAIGLIYLVVTA